MNESIRNHNIKRGILNNDIDVHNERSNTYDACIRNWEVKCAHFRVFYSTELLFKNAAFTCTGPTSPDIAVVTPVVFDEKATYPETDGIQKCLKKYNECIEAAKGACTTTLKDPRTLEDYERFDWEKYHASIDSCKRSFEQCVEANKGMECNICTPIEGIESWECMPCHDPNCPEGDKTWEFYNCECKCDHQKKEEKKEDPWENCDQEKP